MNSRLDEIQCSVLRVKLKYLDEWNARRRRIADKYLQTIDNSKLRLPFVKDDRVSSWHLFVVLIENRERLFKYLQEKNIETAIHYPIPPYKQTCYQYLELDEKLYPKSNYLHDHCLSLPIGPHLSLSEAERVIAILNQYS